MTTSDEAKAKAAVTYNAAADSYDANSFWERFGRETIERLQLQDGARVLDVCCGSGASAIHAAEKVGPKGSVLGVDLTENLLERARLKAREYVHTANLKYIVDSGIRSVEVSVVYAMAMKT